MNSVYCVVYTAVYCTVPCSVVQYSRGGWGRLSSEREAGGGGATEAGRTGGQVISCRISS